MKHLFLCLALLGMIAGCATGPDGGAGSAVYSDPTYPGPGFHAGFGVGSWGSGAGIGIGF